MSDKNPVEMTQDAALRLHSFEMHASKHEAAIFHALVMMLTSCLKCKSDVLTKFELLLHCNCGHDYALDTFNTAIVSPIYYVMFTTLTIVASSIMFKDWSGQDATSIASELCGFITVLSGTIILHSTREHEQPAAKGTITWYTQESMKSISDARFVTLDNSDYFE